MKKILSYSILICIAFLLNISNALAKTSSFVPSSTNEGFSSSNDNKYVLNCESIEASINILEVSNNNESKSNCKGKAGVFLVWDATNSSKVFTPTEKLSYSDGTKSHLLIARSVTGGTTDKIEVTVNNSTTGKSCSGTIKVNNGSGSKKYVDDNSSVTFWLEVKGKENNEKQDFITTVKFYVVKYMGNQGESLGTYSIQLVGNTQKAGKDTTNYTKANDETQKEQINSDKEENQTKVISTTGRSASKPTAGESQKIKCEDSLKEFINKIWKHVMLIAPVLLLVMITADFFKALFSSDQDLIKKAADNTIKRTIATLILLALPLILSTILNFFGIEFCK